MSKLTLMTVNNFSLHVEQWKDSIIVPVYKKGDKTRSNYRSISLLSTTYKILSNILLSKLIPYAEEVIDHECGF
jgi:hypothetical protein